MYEEKTQQMDLDQESQSSVYKKWYDNEVSDWAVFRISGMPGPAHPFWEG